MYNVAEELVLKRKSGFSSMDFCLKIMGEFERSHISREIRKRHETIVLVCVGRDGGSLPARIFSPLVKR